MTDHYGRTYTTKYIICQWVCEAPKVWKAVTVVEDYEEYDTYEMASLLCQHTQLINPGNKYAVVEVRYYEDDGK